MNVEDGVRKGMCSWNRARGRVGGRNAMKSMEDLDLNAAPLPET